MKGFAVVVLGGRDRDPDEFYASQIERSSILVAVDSGAEILMRLNLVPDLLIGDMDSISDLSLSWCSKRGTRIERFPVEKDEPDTELALEELVRLGISRVILLNFNGNRPDHFIATLMLMYGLSDSLDIEARSSSLNIGIARHKKTIDAVVGEIWSILPIGQKETVVTLDGFKYPAINKEFSHTKPVGISNVAVADRVTISVVCGAALYFRWLGEPT